MNQPVELDLEDLPLATPFPRRMTEWDGSLLVGDEVITTKQRESLTRTKMDDLSVNPERQHSMKCPRLYGQDCKCDGYHTFDELYEHRIRLFIALCQYFVQGQREGDNRNVWASTLHSDGTSFGDWFVLGIGKEKGQQITYHLPARFWNEVCDFAEILPRAPEWDGHTSNNVLERLTLLPLPETHQVT